MFHNLQSVGSDVTLLLQFSLYVNFMGEKMCYKLVTLTNEFTLYII